MTDAKFTLWQIEAPYLFIVQIEDVLIQTYFFLSHDFPLTQLYQP